MKNENLEEKISNKVNSFIAPTPIAIIIAAAIFSLAWIYNTSLKIPNDLQKTNIASEKNQKPELEEKVLPTEGVVLPVSWGNLGPKLINAGAIDANKFQAIYEQRNAFTDEYKNLLISQNDNKLKITSENAGYLLNLFWALGLSNKNSILESGEMTDSKYGGPQNFASTAGWTMSKGDPMDHYSKHIFFELTTGQQALVDKISKGIYRPCCGNSTHFPDCNHGVAMLGLLELMASQGVSEQDMWKTALVVNSFWFPDTYINIATYLKDRGIDWKDVNPQEILGANYSSAQGYAKIVSQVIQSEQSRGGNGCGVESGESAPVQQRQQSGCGVQ
ncbi:MAG: hypothetical protein WC849_03430 [Candidatus Paceibacterota bacterium]